MILQIEILVLALLAAVTVRGLMLWHKWRFVISSFDRPNIRDVVINVCSGRSLDEGLGLEEKSLRRRNSWKGKNALLIAGAVAFGIADFILRLNWAMQAHWADTGDMWAYGWLLFHAALALWFWFNLHIADRAFGHIAEWEGIHRDS